MDTGYKNQFFESVLFIRIEKVSAIRTHLSTPRMFL